MPETRSSPRFGIIGAGTIGRIHLEALRDAGLPVVALADPFPAALEQAAPLAAGARLYADWRELLRDPAVEAVNICTINALHFEILCEAVASGKHVFCEKTMTVSAAQAAEALRLPVAPGQAVQTGYMKRFFPASVWARDRLAEIGDPLCATVRSFQGGFSDAGIFDDPAWKPSGGTPSRTRQFASGGMLNMAGSHMLDMTAWLLGEPDQITCHTWSPASYDADLHAHGLFRMRRGTLVHFEACLSNFHKTGAYGNGWDEFIQIDGTRGRLELFYPLWNRSADHPARVRLYREADRSWEEPEMPRVNAFRLELEAFAGACRSGAAASPSIRDAALVDAWIDACYESARTGKTVPLPAVA